MSMTRENRSLKDNKMNDDDKIGKNIAELKKCPFCGGEPNLFNNYLTVAVIQCKNCKAVMETYKAGMTLREAEIETARKWNNRVE